MARTASAKAKPLTCAFSYGFVGGPGLSRRLRKQLKALGLVPTDAIEQADIIVAHSAGCWLIPENARPKLVIYVGMPLAQAYPHKTFIAARRENIQAFFKNLHVLRGIYMALCGLYYGLTQPLRNRDIIRGVKQAQPATEFSGAQAVFIANRNDPWPRSDKLQAYMDDRDWAFIGLPGAHDDIWEHSDRYAAIINYYARLLA
jgi:hypothetical protein